MFTRTIEYTDFDGTVVKEKFHFNLTETELAELNLAVDGGITAFAQNLQKTQDPNGMIKLLKLMITKSYGELVELPNGKKRFLKSDDMANSFVNSDAYSKLFVKLAESETAITDFILGIIPANMAGEVTKEINKQKLAGGEAITAAE